MDDVLAIRPFVPARDFDLSKSFYRALGFEPTYEGADVAVLRQGGCSFMLQNFFHREAAENTMVQLSVRDVAAWWRRHIAGDLVATYAVRPPIAPAPQSWGATVGFVFDPSGVLWHIAEGRS